MPSNTTLWALSTLKSGRRNPLLVSAERDCQNHQCELCIALLSEAVRLEPGNSALHFQMGVCCSGGCRHHPLTSTEAALVQLRRALTLVDPRQEPQKRARILNALANTWMLSQHAPAEVRSRAAIGCYREAAQIYLGLGELAAWAREEFNMGNACCELPDAVCKHKWEEAVSHYRQALRVRTRESDPLGYAATLENLGTAYRELSSGDKTANVRMAIQCYRQALRVCTAWTFPIQHARLDNNLGNAYLSLPCASPFNGRKFVRHALRHFDRALRVRTRDNFPFDYATTQFNRGMAFLRAASEESHPRTAFDNARRCFEESELCFVQCAEPENARRARERAEWVRSCLLRLSRLDSGTGRGRELLQ